MTIDPVTQYLLELEGMHSSPEYNKFTKAFDNAERIIEKKWEKIRQQKCHPIEGKSIDAKVKMTKYTGDKNWMDVDTRNKKIPPALLAQYKKLKLMNKVCTDKILRSETIEITKWIQANIKLCGNDKFCIKEARDTIKDNLKKQE